MKTILGLVFLSVLPYQASLGLPVRGLQPSTESNHCYKVLNQIVSGYHLGQFPFVNIPDVFNHGLVEDLVHPFLEFYTLAFNMHPDRWEDGRQEYN
ncbi:unnamed protein product [Allacma fusca]|uniref:Uncharacterized protein n=1 Tax=Allacma fusca TaxID=39272 RepID=A0A8J2JXC5_9HEXA|nr:unnamed protein product [Allacma fusca]